MSMMVSFVLSFFPRDVLDEILNLIESVSEDFPSYSFKTVSSCQISKCNGKIQSRTPISIGHPINALLVRLGVIHCASS